MMNRSSIKKDVESAKATLKKKMSLLENLKPENYRLNNEIKFFKTEKSIISTGSKESKASVDYYCKVCENLKTKLDNAKGQQKRTELVSANISHTMDTYENKVERSYRTAEECGTESYVQNDAEQILKQVELVKNQICQNSKLIEEMLRSDGNNPIAFNH